MASILYRSVIFLYVALLALGFAEEESAEDIGTKSGPKVCGRVGHRDSPLSVDGILTDIRDFPWHATIYTKDQSSPGKISKKYLCGATIVHSRYALSAAHCLWDEKSRKTIDAWRLLIKTGNVVVEYDSPLNDLSAVINRAVKNVFVHSGYVGEPGNYASNVALLECEKPLQISSAFVPVCWAHLDIDDQFLRSNYIGVAPGPRITSNGDTSNVIQTTSVAYINDDQCASVVIDEHVPLITKDKFCTSYVNGTALSYGSRGGGLVFRRDWRWHVVGIISGGLEAKPRKFGRTWDFNSKIVHIKVSNYVGWIKDVMDNPERYKHPSYFSTSITDSWNRELHS